MAHTTNGHHLESKGLQLDGTVVKMKGLPFKATPEDVMKFFQGFSLKTESIYLKRHPDGRPNGEAFVVFEDADEARRATQKDRETFGEKFGDRYVRVYPTLDSDVADMQAAVLQQTMAQQQGTNHSHVHSDSVVKIKSLPFDATQLDIIQFFDTFKLKPNGVQLVVRSDNKPTGEAFVDFENPEEAARAIREKDHKVFSEKFGDRYVRLIQVSRKEMQATLALRFGGEGILKMKGIPFKATASDVRKFFAGYKIKPEGISFIMHADGRPTGMSFIEFETPQEAVRAMEKDRAKFGPEYGDRFCMLQLVGRHEMDKVTLQKESENTNKMLNGINGINMLQAAAIATQAALNNPALHPILMAGANPLLNPLHLGLMNQAAASAALAGGPIPGIQQMQNPGAGSGGNPMLDATLAAQLASSQLAGQGPSAGLVNGGVPGGLGGLNLLQQQGGAVPPTGAEAPPNWVPSMDHAATNPLLFYPNGHAAQEW
eukprot:CAMPEP_0202914098 /NCGR_PEP_ID=MMETSP1392-20130828/62202_1 /ASSEMBLY_ACC=CAM_ASM_000868 /TAXON_ID=225041 /ORGANISM="Chlamydomonas chlamydogama, Strain SAG 11-48b" /LENGTH=485 /DNA_ID=CAMNT_0049605619 /DNA_START=36 /DNA_END=1490 /DNA_ORIENTATION=+